MGKRIAVILGHPDPDPARFGSALAAACARGAQAAGHEVRVTREWPEEMTRLGREAR